MPRRPQDLTPDSWLAILKSAYSLFDDAAERGFGMPPFSLGGGTVLMLDYKHRLSRDIDLFGHDAQWITLLSPRLNTRAAALAVSYVEQANSVKIVTALGDIDFIVAADVTCPLKREERSFAGRKMEVDPASEILAKKLFYRAAGFTARDVYDMSAAIDLDLLAAAAAAKAARSRVDVLRRRFEELEGIGEATLLDGIVPYDGRLPHAGGMIRKVREFVATHSQGSEP